MKRKATALILTAVIVLTGCGKGTKTIDTADITDSTDNVITSSSTVTETEEIITESLEIDISNYTDTAIMRPDSVSRVTKRTAELKLQAFPERK